jgi:glycerol kinase
VNYVLAIDQGTSSSRALVIDAGGVVRGSAQQEFDQIFPHDGWVEHDPEVIWQTVLAVARGALADAAIDAAALTGIGITNQRETTLLWDAATGEPVHNAIVWQDRRTAARCDAMRAEGMAPAITAATGLVVDPYFSSTKLAWLLDNVPAVRSRATRGTLRFGTVDSFLIWRLTNGARHATDATNASRTQLFNIATQRWDDELLRYFDIPATLLPEVLDCAADYGVADARWLGASVPILGVAGDQQAALIGQACTQPGMTKSTYGTGCFLVTNTGPQLIRSTQGLLSTVGYRIDGATTYAVEGSIFVAGVAVKWLRDVVRLIDSAADSEAAAQRAGVTAGGVYVVPAFTGLGAPYWRAEARGLICGLTLDSDRDDLITATLASVAYQSADLLAALDRDGAPVTQLRVDGGMVGNDWLCQFLADIAGVRVERPLLTETTAVGAGMLAALGGGLVASLADTARLWQLQRRFEPTMAAPQRDALLRGWRTAVARTLTPATGS